MDPEFPPSTATENSSATEHTVKKRSVVDAPIVEGRSRFLDRFVSRFMSSPVRFRMSLRPSLLFGRTRRARFFAEDLKVAEFLVQRIEIDARDVRFSFRRPWRLHTAEMTADAVISEKTFNAYARDKGVPFRVSFRDGGIRARTGVAGIRLGAVDMDFEVDDDVIRITPREFSALGIGIGLSARAAESLRAELPIPELPYGVKVSELRPVHGALEAVLVGEDVSVVFDEEMRENLSRFRKREKEEGTTEDEDALADEFAEGFFSEGENPDERIILQDDLGGESRETKERKAGSERDASGSGVEDGLRGEGPRRAGGRRRSPMEDLFGLGDDAGGSRREGPRGGSERDASGSGVQDGLRGEGPRRAGGRRRSPLEDLFGLGDDAGGSRRGGPERRAGGRVDRPKRDASDETDEADESS